MKGRLISKAPFGNNSTLSNAAKGPRNNVAAKQSSEGAARNNEQYSRTTSPTENRVKAKLRQKASENRRIAAGYEGGKGTLLENNGAGYKPRPQQKPSIPDSPASNRLQMKRPNHGVFDYRKTKFPD